MQAKHNTSETSSDIWTLTHSDIAHLNTFERKNIEENVWFNTRKRGMTTKI
jgi:hypothetical protein